MDFNIEVRKKQLLNLEQFIFTSKDKVHSILNCLGWNTKEVLQEKPHVNCPLDSNHSVAEKNITVHTEKCYLRREGYDLNESFLSDPVHDPQSSIYIENSEKLAIFTEAYQKIPDFKREMNNNVIKLKITDHWSEYDILFGWNGRDRDPKTADRLMSTFSSDERGVLHDFVISHTKGPSPPPEFNIIDPRENPENRTLTEEEILIRQRDARRRRIKYKAVHTNRKSYKEVVREVISGQMELYRDWLEESEKTCKSPKNNCKDNENITDDTSYNSDRILHEYSCDNSVTSRGSCHSESSRSSKKRQNRDELETKQKYDIPEEFDDNNIKMSNEERKYSKHSNHRHHHSRYQFSDSYSNKSDRYRDRYDRKRKRSRSRSKHSSSLHKGEKNHKRYY